MATPDACFYWLLLNRIPGFGPRSFQKLLARYGDLSQLFCLSSPPVLSDLPEGCRQSLQQLLAGYPNHPLVDEVKAEQQWLAEHGATVLRCTDEAYPPLLRQLSSAPALLYVMGEVSALSRPQLAMVGSRNCSDWGRDTAYRFAEAAVAAGLTVTSGLALGIDAASHQGALAAGGPTVAVLASGLDRIYPRRHQALAAEIVQQQGCLVSEFPLGTAPQRRHFPRRNRIISGLSQGVLVVEAALKSGSLLTAHYALEQNREVFAIPGSIHNPMARGCHALIKQGAKLVESVPDITEELPITGTAVSAPNRQVSLELNDQPPANLSLAEQAVLKAVAYEATPVDLIIERSGLSAGEVACTLISLELAGLIQQQAGGYALCQQVNVASACT